MGNSADSGEKCTWSEVFGDGHCFSFKPFRFSKCELFIPVEELASSNIKPHPRSGHRIVCDDANLYSYGGYNPKITSISAAMQVGVDWYLSRPLFRELWRFNFASNKWFKLECANIPPVLASNAVILAGKELIVFGGTGVPFGAHCSNDIYFCDLSKTGALSFSYVPTKGDNPTPKYGQAVVLNDKYLYTIGGTSGYDYSSDVHRLDLETKIWEATYICNGSSDEPPGRYRHEVVFDGENIFILGGGTAEVVYGLEEIAKFSITKNEWQSIKSKPDPVHGFPRARRCHSCVQYFETDDVRYAFVIGGYCNDVVLNDVWRLDLNLFSWHKLQSDYPNLIYFHSSAITNYGKVYTFGGVKFDTSLQSMDRTADVYSMWVTIPKLKEICWEAVLFYNPKLYTSKKSELFNLGIPKEFISRIDFDLNC